MGKMLILIVLYILSWVLHISWVVWGLYLTDKFTPIKRQWQQVCFVFGAWVLVVIISGGCPFFYLHEYLEVQMGWRKEIAYKYEDSYVYQYLVQPTQITPNPHEVKK